jgi:putative transposon-encoded protein
MKENLQIKREVNGDIVKYKTKKKVMKSGNGGVIYLLKELIGKEVYVELK